MDNISGQCIFENLMTLLPIGVFWKDRQRRFLGANSMFLDYYGMESVDEIIGKTDEDLGWHIDPEPFRAVEMKVINNGEEELDVPGQCIVRGKVRQIRASKMPLIQNGEIVGLIGYFVDITDEQAEIDRLSALSTTDELTGLLNRRAYSEISSQYEAEYHKAGVDFVLFMIDLDEFKVINDRYGHEYGNLILIEVGKKLSQVCGESSVLFRYGGDEFIILHQYKSESDIEELQKHIIAAVESPKNIDGMNMTIKTSVGRAFFSEVQFLTDLIEIADRRMYDMKRKHKKK